MSCKKCNQELLDGAVFCMQCGHDQRAPVYGANEHQQYAPIPQQTRASKPEAIKIVKLCIFCALALIVLIVCFVGAADIAEGGSSIGRIRSQGGQTMDEIYYRHLGTVYRGFAMFVRGFGLFSAGVLAWLGLKELD